MGRSSSTVADDGRPAAHVVAELRGRRLLVTFGGDWRLLDETPRWDAVAAESNGAAEVHLRAEDLRAWDTSLVLFLEAARSWCVRRGAPVTTEGLPQRLADLLSRVARPEDRPDVLPRREKTSGLRARFDASIRAVAFVGELVLSAGAALMRPRRFPWRDWIEQLRICGAGALPIVGLISFLVGAIVAYQAAIQLRKFGADLYIADLVSLSITREMGPVMAGIVIAGRTGSAFAAELGKMVASEEIDALRAIGVSPVGFLALPRIAAVVPMLPLLTLYADALGIFGGAAVSAAMLDVPAAAFLVETRKALAASDIATGVIKSVVFGLLVGASGCARGLQAERSSAGVGAAATSAAVTGILLVILADALFGEIFNTLGI